MKNEMNEAKDQQVSLGVFMVKEHTLIMMEESV